MPPRNGPAPIEWTKRKLAPVLFEGVRITYRNFQGREERFNLKGRRNFVVLIDDEEARLMEKDGWNIKWLQPRNEEDTEQAILKVNVKYGGKGAPPRVYLITTRGKTMLDEDTIQVLDWAEIENVDLIVRAYFYDVNAKQGISAYCKAIYVTIREDELEKKYHDVPDVRASIAAAEPDEDEPPF